MRQPSRFNFIVSESITGLLVILVVLLSGCGNDRRQPYYTDKNFGEEANETLNSEEQAEITTEIRNPEDPSKGHEDEVLYNALYRGTVMKDGIFFLESTFSSGIRHTLAETSPFLPVDLRVKIKNIYNKSIDLTAKMTQGNGKTSAFSQQIVSPIDDPADGFGGLIKGDSTSGDVEYRRVLGTHATCGTQMVCVDRILITPKKGMPKSFCFYDPDTKIPIDIPMGASPTVSMEELASLSKNYGPYLVRRFDGAVVNCNSSLLSANVETTIMASLDVTRDQKILDLGTPEIYTEDQKPDFAMRLSYRRLENGHKVSPDVLPYLDDRTGLQSDTIYYFSNKVRELIMILKDVRKEIDVATIPGSWGVLGAWVSGYQGVKVQVRFAYCNDILNPEPVSLCK